MTWSAATWSSDAAGPGSFDRAPPSGGGSAVRNLDIEVVGAQDVRGARVVNEAVANPLDRLLLGVVRDEDSRFAAAGAGVAVDGAVVVARDADDDPVVVV